MENGTRTSTTVTIDAAGRLVIPKRIRQGAGFSAGTLLEIRLQDGRVVLEPAPRSVSIVRRREFYVAEPVDEDGDESEPLSTQQVEEVLRKLREREG